MKFLFAIVFLLASCVVDQVLGGVPMTDEVGLTFDQGVVADFDVLIQSYGDRVTTSPDTNGYVYSVAGTGAPNVTAFYGPAGTTPTLWTTGYGDLTNVYFNNDDFDGSVTIELMADPGFNVGLLSFDLASFIAAGQTIQGLEVRNGDSGDVLYSEGVTAISGSTRNHFDIFGGAFAQSVILEVDLTGLGGQADEIGIDNVRFAQVAVPEPTSFLILLLAGLATGSRRRRD